MKPILFNTEGVRAILDGRKTVTRRVLAYKGLLDKQHALDREPYKCGTGEWCFDIQTAVDDYKTYFLTPPCQPDGILYVRETWCSAYDGERYFYRADKHTRREEKQLLDYDDVRWCPSIHMPKKAARIFLRVTDIRVERLQDIDEEDAKAEGANFRNGKNVGFEEKMRRTAIERFADIWDTTIKKKDIDLFGWNANPWVWVIEFERISREEATEECHVD